MTDRTALWILLPALALLLLTAIATMVWPTTGSRRARRDRHRADLAAALAGSSGTSVELDWLRYGEIPKPDLLAIAEKHHWRLHAETIGPDAWVLRFTRADPPP